jgi:hypothetical protein
MTLLKSKNNNDSDTTKNIEPENNNTLSKLDITESNKNSDTTEKRKYNDQKAKETPPKEMNDESFREQMVIDFISKKDNLTIIDRAVKKTTGISLQTLKKFYPLLVKYLDTNNDKKLSIREVLSKRALNLFLVVLSTILFNPLLDIILDSFTIFFELPDSTLQNNLFIIVLQIIAVPFILLYFFKSVIDEYSENVKGYEMQTEALKESLHNKIADWKTKYQNEKNAYDNEKVKTQIQVAQLEGALEVKNNENQIWKTQFERTRSQLESARNQIFRMKGIDPEILNDANWKETGEKLRSIQQETLNGTDNQIQSKNE